MSGSNTNGIVGWPPICANIYIWGIVASKISNLPVTLKEIIYLLKQATRLFYETFSSEILSLQSANLPKNELSHISFYRVWLILIISLGCFWDIRITMFGNAFWFLFSYWWPSLINSALQKKQTFVSVPKTHKEISKI